MNYILSTLTHFSMFRFNPNAEAYIPTEPCISIIETYPIPKGFRREEAALWDRLRSSGAQLEPDAYLTVRSYMLTDKFKLAKEIITPHIYCIKSVRTPETSPHFEDFKLYYHNSHKMPYKLYVCGAKLITIEEYDHENDCKTIIRTRISKEKRKSYRQTFDHKMMKRTLEVFELYTNNILYTEVLSGEFWLENAFKYTG